MFKYNTLAKVLLVTVFIPLFGSWCYAEEYNTVTAADLPQSIRVLRTATNTVEDVPFKDYVKIVLANEWLPNWRAESYRSGAIAVKNYAWHQILYPKYASSAAYDVKDNTDDQVYNPAKSLTDADRAVDDTWYTKMTRNNALFKTYYNSGFAESVNPTLPDTLSQWGSQMWAKGGKNWRQILHYYYGDQPDVLSKSIDLIFSNRHNRQHVG